MESEKEHEYFILETVEVALIGLFSLVRFNIALMRNQQIFLVWGLGVHLLDHPLERSDECL